MDGKAAMGILVNNKQTWVAVVIMNQPSKTYEGKLYVPTKYLKTARLILVNSNPDYTGLASKFIIEKLELINIKG